MILQRRWLGLLCGSLLILTSWGIGYTGWRDVPSVKPYCERGCSPPQPPSRIYRELPAERPIKEPVYGPSPAEVMEARALAERASRITRELKDRIIRLSGPGSVVSPTSSVVIRPGTPFFNMPGGGGATLAAPLSGVQTPGSKIPMENLQRAAAILSSITKMSEGVAGEDEDVSFLAGQAALAMEGAPLQVAVTGPVDPRVNNPETARQLGLLTEGIQKDRQELETALAARLEAERRLKQKKDGDYMEYRQAFEREQSVRARIVDKELQLEFKFVFVGQKPQ